MVQVFCYHTFPFCCVHKLFRGKARASHKIPSAKQLIFVVIPLLGLNQYFFKIIYRINSMENNSLSQMQAKCNVSCLMCL